MDMSKSDKIYIRVLIILLLITSVSCFQRDRSSAENKQQLQCSLTEKSKIDSLVNLVDRELNTYDTVTSYLENSTEGGELICYLKGIEIKKLKALYYGETGKAEYSFYLKDHSLLYATKREHRYNIPIDQYKKQEIKVDSTIAINCYFENDELYKNNCQNLWEIFDQIMSKCK